MQKTISIPLDAIQALPENQLRATVHEDQIAHFMDLLQDGVALPPVLVLMEGPTAILIDGFHRLEAHKRLGRTMVLAEPVSGISIEEARRLGVERNMKQGMGLSHADKKKAAKALREQLGMGYRSIGKLLGVAASTINRWVNPEVSWVQQENARLHKRRERSDLDDAAFEKALKDAYGPLVASTAYRPKVPTGKVKPGSPGVPILFLSDLHIGETVNPEQVYYTNAFDLDIAKARLDHTFATAKALLLEHLAEPSYPSFVLVLGGDIINGELFTEHTATNALYPLQQVELAAEWLSDHILGLSKAFPKVSVYGVPGNHGRDTRRPWAKDFALRSADHDCYRRIARYCRDLKNVDFNFPAARDLNFTVANRTFRLTHGDQFKGGDGIIGPAGPVIRGDVRKRVSASMIPGRPVDYDIMLCGHFHTLLITDRLICNGSLKGFDEYALQIGAPWEPPRQVLFTVHPKFGVNWTMPILCDPKETKE